MVNISQFSRNQEFDRANVVSIISQASLKCLLSDVNNTDGSILDFKTWMI